MFRNTVNDLNILFDCLWFDTLSEQLLSENMDEFLSVSTGQREADIKEEIDKVKLETCTWKEEMLHKQKMVRLVQENTTLVSCLLHQVSE